MAWDTLLPHLRAAGFDLSLIACVAWQGEGDEAEG